MGKYKSEYHDITHKFEDEFLPHVICNIYNFFIGVGFNTDNLKPLKDFFEGELYDDTNE